MVGFTTVSGALCALATFAVADISYPSTVELFFAVQNVEVAYGYGWSIEWEIDGIGRGIVRSRFEDNEFQYYFDDVAIVPTTNKYAIGSPNGGYRLDWNYATGSCPLRNATWTSWPVRRPIIWGTQYFSIEEDSGSGFDIPLDECPSLGGTGTVDSGEDCPAGSDDQDSDPCAARLTSDGQVNCIWEYVTTADNETETCLSVFERADPDWPTYYVPYSSSGSTDTDGDDSGSGSDESDSPSTENEEDEEDDTGIAISIRPRLIGFITVMFVIAIVTT